MTALSLFLAILSSVLTFCILLLCLIPRKGGTKLAMKLAALVFVLVSALFYVLDVPLLHIL